MPVTYPIHVPTSCEFGFQNIPFGMFSPKSGSDPKARPRAGTAIGDYVLDLDVLEQSGIFKDVALSKPLDGAFSKATLNNFAAFSAADRSLVRQTIIKTLSRPGSPVFEDVGLNSKAFTLRSEVQMHIPMSVTDFSDSFGSLIHAENGLAPFGLPLVEAWFDFPLGYHGRNGGLTISGTDVVRPTGLYPTAKGQKATLQPSKQLDFEIELAFFISSPVPKGKTITAKEGAEHIFGFVLLNDWSARDIQKHEMTPLGVFNSKSFSTSISPWIVTLDALQSSPTNSPPSNNTDISSFLVCDAKDHGLFDLDFTAKVSRHGAPAVDICQSNLKHAYWSPYQVLAYNSYSGCGLNTGDLMATGTNSSPPIKDREKYEKPPPTTCGCLVEVFGLGERLPDVGGKPMGYLEDGDALTVDAWFNTADGGRAGFGPLIGLVKPADQ